jgi:uncharacterized hydrophobic protein (TIGR00271 family)
VDLARALRKRIGLIQGADLEATDRRLRAGARLSPEQFWLLGCSALLACIGLDTGSAAVIIGAMLISPLMGPILAIGFAAETNDRELLVESLRELALAVAAGFIVSAVYFLLTPLAAPTSELVSRTHPTLLDVGVAFFGGLAGIAAASRREPSLALPGVAIATALMPPLCTAGFGLATAQPAFLFGAFYLFVINAVFIALATAIMARLLRFPTHAFADEVARRRSRNVVRSIVTVAALPSLWFFYRAAVDTQERRQVERFIAEHIRTDHREALRWDLGDGDEGRALRIYVGGTPVEPEEADSLRKLLPSYGLEGRELRLVQSELTAQAIARLRTDAVQGVLEALSEPRRELAIGPVTQAQRVRAASRELAAAFPEISSVTFASLPDALAPDSVAPRAALLVGFRAGVRGADERRVLERSAAFVRERLPLDSLRVLRR